MRLNVQTDYALRLLTRLAMRPNEIVTIETIAREYRVSRNHLMKVAHQLGRLGYIETVRGRTGGLRLARDPAELRIGDIVRQIEPDFALVECFRPDRSQCVIGPACRLRSVLGEAMASFLATLNRYSLADLMAEKTALEDLLGVRS